ncbi:Beta-glucosidase 24 [Linum perenne]
MMMKSCIVWFLCIPILFALDQTLGLPNNGSSSISPHLKCDPNSLKGSQFPPEFLFGAAVSAYQTEGAAMEDGKGLSIWDEFTHKHPEKIADKSNGDIAADSYHLYKKDIAMVKQMGMKAYRFSISWTRILPSVKLSGRVNHIGIQHYNDVINEVIAQGLIPFVTILHFDPPQSLEEEYGGFLSKKIVNDFRDYADICFKEFGDRVKYWITLNEPYVFSLGGYATGGMAPGRCTTTKDNKCDEGNSAVEPYLAAHNQLLAHAAVVSLYRQKYQATQKGLISITLNTDWFIPYTSSKEDTEAAQRALDFSFGWFMDPLTTGDYPKTMKDIVGNRLPKFTKEESKLLKGSLDFLGINYYTSRYAFNYNGPPPPLQSYISDPNVNYTSERDGKLIGPATVAFWLNVYPEGLKDLLLYIKDKYNNPLIYITENGVPDDGKLKSKAGEAPADAFRIDALSGHLSNINMAIKEGSNVKGYMGWSLIDSFEWQSGYTMVFGLHYIDFRNPSIRIPKQSALWFKQFLSR